MQKINKKYRVLNPQNKSCSDDNFSNNLNKSEKIRKHNLETPVSKPNRSNYENVYKSHIPGANNIQRNSGKFNYSLNQSHQNKTNLYERKSSPLQKFEPNSYWKDEYESPAYLKENEEDENVFNEENWNSEKEYYPHYTPSESESQK